MYPPLFRNSAGLPVDPISSQAGEKKLAYTRHEPIGVVGQILPWNYPCKQSPTPRPLQFSIPELNRTTIKSSCWHGNSVLRSPPGTRSL